MPFFGDLGKLAESLLDTGRDSNIFFDSTKVCLKTKASNGAAFEFNKEIGDAGKGDADGKVSYKHSSGINMKEVKMDTDGVTSVKAELKGAVDNTTLNMAIKQNPRRGEKDGGKLIEDGGSLGFKYDDKTVAADCSVDFLAADAPLIKANVVSAVPGVDGAHVGFDMQFKTALDTMAGHQKDTGAHSLTTFPWKVGAQYALSDMQLAAIYDNKKKTAQVKYQQVLASDCTVGAQVDLKGLFDAKKVVKPAFTLGGSYNLDPDTTVYSRLKSADSELSLGVEQKLNSKVTVNMSTAVNAGDMSNHKFGFGIELSN